MKLKKYPGVRGAENVARISAALEASGARIVVAPDPTVAPYEYVVEANRQRYDLVCYAFTANKYRQLRRPTDEHRFQIKYGSEFHRHHDIYLDPSRRRTTLMFGVHHELGMFVAVDPLMHTPTWFSVSVEFKERDLLLARRRGWHGWERERSPGRRRTHPILPMESFQTEAVIAFTPKHFLQYVEFERLGYGLDAAERLLVWSELAQTSKLNRKHALEVELGLSRDELLDVLGGTSRLLVAVRGRVAEHHLGRFLQSVPGVSSVTAVDTDGPPDFEITYRNRRVRIECKNTRKGLSPPRIDFQKTRASKSDKCSRYYSKDQFEVLAACMHPVTSCWNYLFCPTIALEKHKTCPGKLSQYVTVSAPSWSSALPDVLDRIA